MVCCKCMILSLVPNLTSAVPGANTCRNLPVILLLLSPRSMVCGSSSPVPAGYATGQRPLVVQPTVCSSAHTTPIARRSVYLDTAAAPGDPYRRFDIIHRNVYGLLSTTLKCTTSLIYQLEMHSFPISIIMCAMERRVSGTNVSCRSFVLTAPRVSRARTRCPISA